MSVSPLHKTQVSILHSLRYSEAERFNMLMKPTDHTSDTFKFHLRKLIKLGYVEKRDDGTYHLTPVGKEFANNLDEQKRVQRKQPKLSVFIVASRQGSNGDTEFLLFKRARNPFMGYWTVITDTVRWGESFEEVASKALFKQTELEAQFYVHSMRRIRDFARENNELLEDKMFVVMETKDIKGKLKNNYSGGHHEWLTLDELRSQEKYFSSTIDILENLVNVIPFVAQDLYHGRGTY